MDGGTQLGLDALDPAFASRPLVRVTPARLGTWADCPRRYRLTYVDRPAPPRSGARAASTLGAVVHLALRAFYDLPEPGRTADAAAALVDRNWNAEGFRDADQAAEYRLRAREWVADYVAGPGAGATPVGLERWVSVSTPRIIAEGRVDRVDRRPGADGTASDGAASDGAASDGAASDGGDALVVVDYKTGRVPAADEARGSAALALYALATERTLRAPCRRVELHHVPTGEVTAAVHDAASLAGHLARIEDAAADIARAAEEVAAGAAADAVFPARPAPRCGSCDVRRHCPEGRAAAPESEPWASLAR
jgi:RecB family exonuclease